jgi:hypothetical protein
MGGVDAYDGILSLAAMDAFERAWTERNPPRLPPAAG